MSGALTICSTPPLALLRPAVYVLALLTLTAGPVAAIEPPQTQAAPPQAVAPQPPAARPSADDVKRQMRDELKAKLKITTEQESALDKLITAMIPSEAQLQKSENMTRAVMSAKNIVEQLEGQLTLLREREKQLVKHVEIVRSFYTLLTPEQRKLFDGIARQPRH